MTVALLVEDGTGLTGANAYVSAADFATYFANRGITPPPADPVTAVLRATQYLQSHYSGRWVGFRLLKTQGLAWPRVMSSPLQWSGAPFTLRNISYLLDKDGFPILSNEVPQAVKDACCELALAAASGVDLSAPLGPGLKSFKAGDTEEVYAGPFVERPAAAVSVDQMLEPFLISLPGASFTNVQVVRG